MPAVGPAFPAAVWGDVAVAMPWDAFQTFGDVVALREQYVSAQAWVDSGIPRGPNGLWNHSYYQYGDWLDPLAPSDNPGGATTDSGLVADAYLVHVTTVLADMARALGPDFADDVTHYEAEITTLKAAYRAAWLHKDANGTVLVANETQTGLALTLYFDLFGSTAEEDAAAARLGDIIVANDHLVGTGFAGTHVLGHALTRFGLTPLFYEMLGKTTVPSWLYQVVSGGTTTWERWDSLLPNGTVNPNMMTSFNHYAFGSVASWMFKFIGGIAPAVPGWSVVRVEPIPGGGITSAHTSYLSPYGLVEVEWSTGDDVTGFQLELKVPPNSRAEVVIPGAASDEPLVVGSGTHLFSLSGEYEVIWNSTAEGSTSSS